MRRERSAQAPAPSSGGIEVMRDEKKQDRKVDTERVAKNMNRINREIELSLFFLKHGCPG
jgi:hypothetical protein